jgi:formylglycine-generating enzyme required for sulfatase activity
LNRATAVIAAIGFLLTAGCRPQPLAPTAFSPRRSVAPTSSLPPERPQGEVRQDAYGIQQVWVPSGHFMMGSDTADGQTVPSWAAREPASESPQHRVEITAGFWLDKVEVTNAAYQTFIDAGGYTQRAYWSPEGWDWLTHQIARPPRECEGMAPAQPRACITWFEAEAYATWRGGRLPTEAEWEHAARGPDSLAYPWGDVWTSALANVVDSQGSLPVGSFPGGASWVGALDMSGNLMEWVNDWLDVHYYETSPLQDPPGPEGGFYKVEKGGWWGSVPYVARAAYRHFEDPPEYQDHHIGFRVLSPDRASVP